MLKTEPRIRVKQHPDPIMEFYYTRKDVDIIRWQLERNNIFIAGIVERCEYGYPRIMVLDPDNKKKDKGSVNFEALSNLFWLTCPHLNESIHRLEDQGFIEKITTFISADQNLSSLMKQAHARFYFLRKMIYNRFIGPEMPLERIRLINSGIAGTSDTSTLKCLHAHFAFSRVCNEDVAGYITAHLLELKLDCVDGKCRNAH